MRPRKPQLGNKTQAVSAVGEGSAGWCISGLSLLISTCFWRDSSEWGGGEWWRIGETEGVGGRCGRRMWEEGEGKRGYWGCFGGGWYVRCYIYGKILMEGDVGSAWLW